MSSTSNYTDSQMSYGGIPVRNIWLLMLYASDMGKDSLRKMTGIEQVTDELPDLLAQFLCAVVRKRLRRNLSYGYVKSSSKLNRVRGRIELLQTEREQLLKKGQVFCSYEELTIDTLQNRFVLAVLEKLASMASSNKQSCKKLAATLKRAGVGNTFDYQAYKRSAQRCRIHGEDAEMHAVAALVFEMAIPTQCTGERELRAPEIDMHWLRRLFEKAVAGFYRHVLQEQGWTVVSGKQLSWPVERYSRGVMDVFPQMKTDIVLWHPALRKRIIVDTKFTSILKKGYYRDKTLSSNYLYQIYAYVRSQEHLPEWENTTGILLHPSIGIDVDEELEMSEHRFRFMTVDLAQSSTRMRDDLLKIVN